MRLSKKQLILASLVVLTLLVTGALVTEAAGSNKTDATNNAVAAGLLIAQSNGCAAPLKDGTILISPDGKNRRVLRKPAFAGMSWSRDGLILYGLEEGDSGQRIVAVNVERGGERELARIPSSFSLRPIWIPGMKMSLSPDGKSLATTTVRQSGDVWLLENFDPTPLWQRIFDGKR